MATTSPEVTISTTGDVPTHVQESIDTVAELRAKMDREVATHQLGIEWFTKRLGRPTVVYGSLGFVAIWIGVNGSIQANGRTPFDAFSRLPRCKAF